MSRQDVLSGEQVQTGAPASEQDRLLRLYWNRAELKRDYAEIRRERDGLLERLKEKNAEILRAQDQLESLESILTNPASALNAVVHFQLRALWRSCHQKLAQLAVELRQQQEEKERRDRTREFNQQKQERLRSLEEQISEQQARADKKRIACVDLADSLTELKEFWHWFRRRSTSRQLDELTSEYEAERERLKRLRDERERVASEPWPQFGGLSTDARRTINLAVIALAQRLYLHFSPGSLASMAKAAMLKPVQAVDYGGVEKCNQLIERIGHAMAATTADRAYASELRHRSEHLMARAEYRGDADVVPNAVSVGTVREGFDGEALPERLSSEALDVNVLAEDYWDLYRALVG
ncbi:hypothetical protein BH24PSE2_BH24PSE2_00920 [soil metagenome]